jgi:hypothetical protein
MSTAPVALNCNPSYMGGKISTIADSMGKNVCETPSQQKKSWVWWCEPVILAIWGHTNSRIMVQTGPDIKQDHISK